MHFIEIDDQVFVELGRRATGFHVTPNDVLRQLLSLTGANAESVLTPAPAVAAPINNPSHTLLDFIKSDRFKRHYQAVDRYLILLGWLHAAKPKEFTEATLGFRRGNRQYFAKSEREVLQSGEGLTAKPIPKSPFWALTTLDNRTKRMILEDVLRAMNYPPGEMNIVLAEIPDSGIRRSHSRDRLNNTL